MFIDVHLNDYHCFALMFIGFHGYSLVFIGVHWFSLITIDYHKKLIFLSIIMFFQQILTLSIIQAPTKVTEIGSTSVVEHIRFDFQEFILKTSSLCVFRYKF